MVEQHLAKSDRFVTRLVVLPGNRIEINIDGDTPVSIQDCVNLTRHIESKLNREEEDFSLEISSHGANSPLLYKRQYPKHIGRELRVSTAHETIIEGKLTGFYEDFIELTCITREKKALGKGKIDVERKIQIPFSEIKESKIKLKF